MRRKGEEEGHTVLGRDSAAPVVLDGLELVLQTVDAVDNEPCDRDNV